MPLKRGSLQPGDTGRGTRNPFGGGLTGFLFGVREMDKTSGKRGFTTAILHSDRDAAIEHGALHKPLHTVGRVRLQDARELAAVFQGKATGYAYGRQGNPTTAALEAKVNAMEDGVATVVLRHRHGGDRRGDAGAAEGRRPRRRRASSCSATRTACSARSPRTARR